MHHVRRQQEAMPPFAWPPTREDLDLIEVVDAGTLRPVHARCDEPEPALAAAPELLKTVTPVPPVVVVAPIRVSPLDLAQASAPMSLRSFARRAMWSSWSFLSSWSTWKESSRWLALQLDRNLVLATGGIVAIALSAYISLRTAPSVSPSDGDQSFVALSQTPIRPWTPPPLSRVEPGWWPIAKAPAQPPIAWAPGPASTATTPAHRTPAESRSDLDRAVEPSRHGETTLARTSALASTRTPRTPRVVPALNTWRSPFLSNVIAAMPSSTGPALPALTPAVSTTRSVRSSTPVPSTEAYATGMPAPPAPATSAAHPPSAPVSAAAATSAPATPVASRDRDRDTRPSQPPAQQQIYAALHAYERAYGQLDANAVREVWPSVDARALARAFHDLKSQTVVFDRCDIDVAHDMQAVAACRGRATYETRAGQQASQTEPREWTFTLQKSDESWRIVSASAH